MNDRLHLTAEEQAMLNGEQGIAVRRAMEIVVALGKIYGAKRFVSVQSVQVSGVSYKNLGEAGLDFLREWAAQGARVRVPTMLNPAGIDLAQWPALGFSTEFAQQQQAVITAYTAMGVVPTCTCTPYLVGNRPAPGEHVAWAESSAVSFANSVLGARTNREGGPSALAAAICGRTAAYGLHLDENRLATHRVEVRCRPLCTADWGALGYLIGRQVRNGAPYLLFADPVVPTVDQLKSLGAAMAASGAVALYHIDGMTPEAQAALPKRSLPAITINRLSEGYAALNGESEQIDLVSVGCPHASSEELAEIARLVEGKSLHAALWVTTARATREQAAQAVAVIEAAGGRVVADTCMVVAPVEQLGFRAIATNSAKMAFYAPAHSRLSVHFGPLEQCIEAALAGRWKTST